MYKIDGIEIDSLSELMGYLKAKKEGSQEVRQLYATPRPVRRRYTTLSRKVNNFAKWTSEADSIIIAAYSDVPKGRHISAKEIRRLCHELGRSWGAIKQRKMKLQSKGLLKQPEEPRLAGKQMAGVTTAHSFPRIPMLTKDAEKVFYDSLKHSMIDGSYIDLKFAKETLQRADGRDWLAESTWLFFCEDISKMFPEIAKALGVDPHVLKIVMEDGFHRIKVG